MNLGDLPVSWTLVGGVRNRLEWSAGVYARLYPLSHAMRHSNAVFKLVLMQDFSRDFRGSSLSEGGQPNSGHSCDNSNHQNWLKPSGLLNWHAPNNELAPVRFLPGDGGMTRGKVFS